MTSLRLRLLLGYGYLVALLVLTAGSAAFGFLTMSSGIDEVLQDNFSSISASMRMLEALERQDSATLALLLEPGAEMVAQMEEQEAAFAENARKAESNVTEHAEAEVVRKLAADYARYRAARAELLARKLERPLAEYKSLVFPHFFQVKTTALELLDLNHAAMERADRDARQTALRHGAWLGLLVTIALLSLVGLSRAMQRQVLVRLAHLREVSEAIAAGDEHRRLPAHGEDELAMLARRFNATLDRGAALAAKMQGRLSLERQLVLALARRLPEATAVLALDGDLLLDVGPPLGLPAQEALARWIHQEGKRHLHEPPPKKPYFVATPEGRLALELLLAGPDVPVAWLFRHHDDVGAA